MKILIVILALACIGFKVNSLMKPKEGLVSQLGSFDPVTELNFDLCNAKGNIVQSSEVEGKTVLLYFSASWCPPCRSFTPVLVDYQKRHGDKVEVILVSSDKSRSDMLSYIQSKKMDNFYCVDYSSPKRKALKKKFGVSGIPSVVVISPSGNVADINARRLLSYRKDLPEHWTL